MTDNFAFTPSSTDLPTDWPREPGDSMTFAPALSAEEQAIVERFESAPNPYDTACIGGGRAYVGHGSDVVLLAFTKEVGWWRNSVGFTPAEARHLAAILVQQADQCCPTCSGPVRETVGMVCQTCGADYAAGA